MRELDNKKIVIRGINLIPSDSIYKWVKKIIRDTTYPNDDARIKAIMQKTGHLAPIHIMRQEKKIIVDFRPF